MSGLIATRDGQWVRPDQIDAVERTAIIDATKVRAKFENWRILVDGTWLVGSSPTTAGLVTTINEASHS